jgi:hypothetical protein
MRHPPVNEFLMIVQRPALLLQGVFIRPPLRGHRRPRANEITQPIVLATVILRADNFRWFAWSRCGFKECRTPSGAWFALPSNR